MKKLSLLFALGALSLALTAGPALAVMTSGGGYQIWADVVSVGGLSESVSGDGFVIADTVGENFTGQSSSTGNVVRLGFQEMTRDMLSLSLSGNSLALGSLSNGSAATASHNLTINTNSVTGLTVSYTGTTLTSGANTITAIGPTATASAPGTAQFGLHTIATSASVSSAYPTYANASQYAMNSGDNIISASAPLGGPETYAVTYIANVPSGQAPGNYSASITYTALANF